MGALDPSVLSPSERRSQRLPYYPHIAFCEENYLLVSWLDLFSYAIEHSV